MREASRVSTACPTRAAILAVGVAVGVLSLATGCGAGAASVTVPMTWQPTAPMNVNAFAGAMPQSAVFVGPVTDKRQRPKQVGENVEQGAARPKPVFPQGEPATFVRDATVLLFKKGGMKVVASDASADRIVTVELNSFWTREADTYLSDISATFHVKDRSGRELWKGTVSGAAKNWGRSLSAENYQQVFSDGTVQMIEGLLGNAGFRDALKATGGQAAGGP
jgi:hypothetical protein